uniref:Uncharacterized protein n=1 Tax=Arion vulgaris TaxID=1028688 RepID=A0A0B7ABX4_9EUPU
MLCAILSSGGVAFLWRVTEPFEVNEVNPLSSDYFNLEMVEVIQRENHIIISACHLQLLVDAMPLNVIIDCSKVNQSLIMWLLR